MSDIALTLSRISHKYDESDWRLSVEAFSLATGTLTGIIGPNGSGKSTLLQVAAGVLIPSAGEVRLGDGALAGMERRAVARRLGYLPQEVSSLFDYRVEEVVCMGRYPHAPAFGALGTADLEVVERCLERTEMKDLRNRSLSHLSGGERKRALLASVLAQEPEIMLLDEPTAALDVHHQVQFFQLLRGLAGGGMGIAAVTHDVNLAALFCDRIILMDAGRFVAEGPPAEVLQSGHLDAVYGSEILLSTHPETGCPLVLPRRAEGDES
jgi:iron complex transport system ATP-binding protein